MQITQSRPRTCWIAGIGLICAVMVLVAGIALSRSWLPWADKSIQGTELSSFPSIDGAALDATQVRVLVAAKRQFDKPSPGTTYAEGADEPWCADFVSWVMREAGVPLSNPNSGSWRIPGVYTLQEYYESTGEFQSASSGYVPKPGDVIMYNASSPFGQHTNIVVSARAGAVTTVGGNENGKIRAHTFAWIDDPGIVGFGAL
jgi:CHAP domain